MLSYDLIESNKFETVVSLIPPDAAHNTLLLVDIDDTLIAPKETVAREYWFSHFKKYFRQKGLLITDADQKVAELYTIIGKKECTLPIQPTLPHLLRDLNKMGVSIIGLTARNYDSAKGTHTQLRAAGVDDFTKHANIAPFSFLDKGLQVGYSKGIIYAGNYLSKGDCLKAFMQEANAQPLGLTEKRHLFFVDDRMKNLISVHGARSAFKSLQTYIGIRLNKTDPIEAKCRNRTSHNIIHTQAKVLLEHGVLLDDAQAQAMRRKQARGEPYIYQKPLLNAYNLRGQRRQAQGQVELTKPPARLSKLRRTLLGLLG